MSRVQLVPALVFTFGGIAAVSGYLAINDYAIAPFEAEIDRAASETSAVLTESIDRHIAIAESTAALFSGPDVAVNRWAFLEFTRTLPDENPALSAIEWLPRVAKDQRVEFEKTAHADGLFDFRFVEPAADGRRVPAAQRSEYHPIYYVEPYAGNEAVLGLDLGADDRIAAFLAQVRDAGKTAAAPADLMSGALADRPGISILVPVFRTSIIPTTVAGRRDALSGFVRTTFRFDLLFEALQSSVAGLPELDIYIFDRDAANELSLIHAFSSQVADSPGRPINAKDALRSAYVSVEHAVAGQRWTIVVKPVDNIFQSVVGFTAWGFAAFTLLLTALLLRHLITIRLAKDQAEAANRAKSEFLAMMGHELRTPLTAVIGFSDMMVGELFGPLSNKHYKQYTAHINSSATHLLELINSILNLSKVEDGHYRLEKEEFELADIWRSVFDILQASISESGVEVDEQLSKSPIRLNADPVAIRQILLNLVSNAIKFTGQGGRVSVTVSKGPEGRLILQVIDTGIGIAQEHLDLVLKPFRQVDNTMARMYEGIGVGLPLTRKLVELQGGELRIESKVDEGTEVSVIFPRSIIVTGDKARAKAEPPRQDK
ncbi:MAG: CHASE domain-containing protein, partial [Alphaproteobacteria bacterium]|nr:CHASE domain-containing protein [Alphaproteobacteria bacterium]